MVRRVGNERRTGKARESGGGGWSACRFGDGVCDTHKRNQIGDPIQPRTSRDEENKRLGGIAFFSWDDRKKETRARTRAAGGRSLDLSTDQACVPGNVLDRTRPWAVRTLRASIWRVSGNRARPRPSKDRLESDNVCQFFLPILETEKQGLTESEILAG